jgi:ectoine hydroxylase-related dioxygenase (phytanoyl-CoA dioxygenase family)
MSTALAEPSSSTVAGPDRVAAELFERDGYCSVPQLLPRDEALGFRAAALAYSDNPGTKHYSDGAVFRQLVNVWRDSAALRALTFHPLVLAAVRRLAGGRRMRLWHDQILIKKPRNGHASEFHQDEPYWPVERSTFTISAWIALGDATVEHGCMGFIPGTHRRRDLRGQNLSDASDLMGLWPELAYAPRVLCPLRAGGSTFHQGFTAHRAGANETDEARVAFSVIWVEADARYTGAGHVVTDGLGLKPGDTLPDAVCPLI